MPPRRVLNKTSIFNKTELLARFRQLQIKELHAWNLWKYAFCLYFEIEFPRFLIRNPEKHWTEAPHLPKLAHDLIDQEFSICTSKLITEDLSSDQETRKLLIELEDGFRIETVIMKYNTTGEGLLTELGVGFVE